MSVSPRQTPSDTTDSSLVEQFDWLFHSCNSTADQFGQLAETQHRYLFEAISIIRSELANTSIRPDVPNRELLRMLAQKYAIGFRFPKEAFNDLQSVLLCVGSFAITESLDDIWNGETTGSVEDERVHQFFLRAPLKFLMHSPLPFEKLYDLDAWCWRFQACDHPSHTVEKFSIHAKVNYWFFELGTFQQMVFDHRFLDLTLLLSQATVLQSQLWKIWNLRSDSVFGVPPGSPTITYKEIAELADCTMAAVRRWKSDDPTFPREVPRKGRTLRFLKKEIEDWLRNRG